MNGVPLVIHVPFMPVLAGWLAGCLFQLTIPPVPLFFSHCDSPSPPSRSPLRSRLRPFPQHVVGVGVGVPLR